MSPRVCALLTATCALCSLLRVRSACCYVQLAMCKVFVAHVDHDTHEVVALHAVHGGRPREPQRVLPPQDRQVALDRQVAVFGLDGGVDAQQGKGVLANRVGILQLHDHGAAVDLEHCSQLALDQAYRAI